MHPAQSESATLHCVANQRTGESQYLIHQGQPRRDKFLHLAEPTVILVSKERQRAIQIGAGFPRRQEAARRPGESGHRPWAGAVIGRAAVPQVRRADQNVSWLHRRLDRTNGPAVAGEAPVRHGRTMAFRHKFGRAVGLIGWHEANIGDQHWTIKRSVHVEILQAAARQVEIANYLAEFQWLVRELGDQVWQARISKGFEQYPARGAHADIKVSSKLTRSGKAPASAKQSLIFRDHRCAELAARAGWQGPRYQQIAVLGKGHLCCFDLGFIPCIHRHAVPFSGDRRDDEPKPYFVLPPFFRAGSEAGTLFDGEACVEHTLLVKRLADDLQA